MSVHDAVVIGGGLAGAAFAIELAAAGRDVVVVERESGPHDKVCGEFLSGEAVAYLDRLGIDLPTLGAVPIATVGLSKGTLGAAYPLPFPAMSLSRRRLDEALLHQAAAAGAQLRRGSAAIGLQREADCWTLRLADGRTIAARTAVLATGKHDLRGFSRPPGRQNDLIGLKRHYRLTASASAALAGRVELALFPGGYAGFEPVEDGLANLCLVVRAAQFAAHGRDGAALLTIVAAATPSLSAHLAGATPVGARPLAIARIPYGLVQAVDDGLWRLGDQAAVIPSFAGEGMSIALHSAHLAAAAYLAGQSSGSFQRRLAADVGSRVALATALSRALVHGPLQAAAVRGARAMPGVLAMLASATRLSATALAGISQAPHRLRKAG